MLMPKRVKYRKQFRGRMRGKATRGNQVSFGEYGLQALEPACAVVKPGRVMFEIAGVPEDVAREAFRLASHKLPIKTQVISRAETSIEGGSEA